jgi:formyltetrahydrofolate dehydrogenase
MSGFLLQNSFRKLLFSRAIKCPLGRHLSTTASISKDLRIAIIGQSVFGQEVYSLLKRQGKNIVGVFTVPDVNGRPDPLAAQAEKDGVRLFKYERWRFKGSLLSEVYEEYKSVGATLNVLPYCTQFIPMEVINGAPEGSIIYHPSLLPLHRGASAINWTLMEGDPLAGFTIFWADDGLDTGPILLQKSCNVSINDTVDSLYNRFLFPEGIRAMGEAVKLIEDGKAPRVIQWEGGATYDKKWTKKLSEINWDQSALALHNFIRGNDKLPGAWTTIDGQKVTLYGSSFIDSCDPVFGREIFIEGLNRPALITDNGLVVSGNDGKKINVGQIQLEDGRTIPAWKWGREDKVIKLELTPEEETMKEQIRVIWSAILGTNVIDDQTDFFKAGASSMDVTRLIEEIDQETGVNITNDEVYMNTRFEDLITHVIMTSRGEGMGVASFDYEGVTFEANKRTIKCPRQLFIDGEFIDSSNKQTLDIVNPTDETVLCSVESATKEDVDKAVTAAKRAFEGEWGKMNARDRASLMYKLADLMDEHKEELATLESLDSGAVYTLALKTHVGFSIDCIRYFAGWCDKIQGKTIPINHARPSRNISITKREPIGVCGIIVPWNYPLMMLAWKLGPCLAAGNTAILKPAQVFYNTRIIKMKRMMYLRALNFVNFTISHHKKSFSTNFITVK